jgi:hypothetical protein
VRAGAEPRPRLAERPCACSRPPRCRSSPAPRRTDRATRRRGR